MDQPHRGPRSDRWHRRGPKMHPAGNQADLELVARYLADPRDASLLVERLRVVPRLVAVRNARYGRPLDGHDLDDLVQDVLVLVLKKLRDYRGSGSLDAFCYRIADLELRNRIRARRRARRAEVALETDEGPPCSPSLESDDRALTALERLGGVEAEAIRLHLFEGLDFATIARRTATTFANARTRYYRGMERLRSSWKSPITEEGRSAS